MSFFTQWRKRKDMGTVAKFEDGRLDDDALADALEIMSDQLSAFSKQLRQDVRRYKSESQETERKTK